MRTKEIETRKTRVCKYLDKIHKEIESIDKLIFSQHTESETNDLILINNIEALEAVKTKLSDCYSSINTITDITETSIVEVTK